MEISLCTISSKQFKFCHLLGTSKPTLEKTPDVQTGVGLWDSCHRKPVGRRHTHARRDQILKISLRFFHRICKTCTHVIVPASNIAFLGRYSAVSASYWSLFCRHYVWNRRGPRKGVRSDLNYNFKKVLCIPM